MKTKNIFKIAGLLITLFFVACKGGSTPATTYTYYPSTSTSTSSTSTGSSDPCPNPLYVTVTSLTGTPYVNQPVQFRTLANGRCGSYKQTTQTASGFFTSTYDFSMTFTTAGSQTITVSVDAYDQAQVNVLETKTAQVTINVQNPPPSGNPPTCMITRNGYVADNGAPLPIIMTATSSSAIADVKINEQAAALNVTIPLFPNPLGSRFFAASGKVTDVDGRIGTCNLAPNTPAGTFEAPRTDSVKASLITYDSVTLEARIYGPVGRGALNGVAIPYSELPTGGNNLMTKKIVPPGPGKYIPRADVYNDTAYGADHGSAVGPEYCVPSQPIAATGTVWSDVPLPFQMTTSANGVISGFGSSSMSNARQIQKKVMNLPIVSGSYIARSGHCAANEVVMGLQTGFPGLYCMPTVTVGTSKVILQNETTYMFGWLGRLGCAGANEVMVGISHDPSRTSGANSGPYGTMYLSCATPVWQDCQ